MQTGQACQAAGGMITLASAIHTHTHTHMNARTLTPTHTKTHKSLCLSYFMGLAAAAARLMGL